MDDENYERESRAEVEITIGGMTVSLSFVNTPHQCIRECVAAVTEAVLSKKHFQLRSEGVADEAEASAEPVE